MTAMLGASSDLASSEKLRQILGIDRPFLKRYMFFCKTLLVLIGVCHYIQANRSLPPPVRGF